MGQHELPSKIIELANKYQGYVENISTRFRQTTSKYSKQNLLDPTWFTEEKLPIAMNRIKRLEEAGAKMAAEYEQYSISFTKEIYDLAYSQDSNTRERVLGVFIEKTAFEANQFKLTLILYNDIARKSYALMQYLSSITRKYEINGNQIGFYEDEDIDTFNYMLMDIARSHEELGAAESHTLPDLRSQLEGKNESYL